MKFNYKIYIFFLCLHIFNKAFGQNLMINGGFEQTQINSNYYQQSINNAVSWFNSIGSADLLHPNTIIPFHYNPRNGNGHAWTANNVGLGASYREIFYGKATGLVAGNNYLVEFYVSRSDGTAPLKFGAFLAKSGTLPNQFYTNQTNGEGSFSNVVAPQILYPDIWHIMPTHHSYIKVTGCFYATQSGTHDILIGCFENTDQFTEQNSPLNGFRVDDVSVTLNNSIISPIAEITMSNIYCMGDQIIADGTPSINDLSHEWEIYKLFGSSYGLIRRIPISENSAGLLNISNYILPQPGECYKIVLHTYNECRDSYEYEFCIDNPSSASIVFNGQPVCEGQSFDLEVTGENGWTYAWSTGQSGVGLKNITTIADPNVTQYSVTVTTPSGCQSTESVDIVVHANNNFPPSISGINGGNETIAYANAGGNLSFNIYTSDSPNEIVKIISVVGKPNGSVFNLVNSFQESGSFTWNNIPNNAEGLYSFMVTAEDNNTCGLSSTEKTFYIKIVCEDCPLDVYYENRTPNNSPLPSSTIAGHKIVAGENVDPNQTNGLVETGNDFVTLRAPIIDLMPGFTGGSNFDAIIDAGTCLQDCETFCCEQFTGFSYDTPIGNVFTPGNQDGVNDFWYLRDEDNPFCAFGGATKFRLEVYQGQTITYVKEEEPVGCCPFVSPAPSNPIAYSSIFWDGRNNTPLGGNNLVLSGDYQWIVKIWSPCGDEITLSGQVYVFGSNSGMILEDEDGYSENLARIYEEKEQDESDFNSELTVGLDAENTSEVSQIRIFPNPSIDKFQICGVSRGDKVEVVDIMSKVIQTNYSLSETLQIDLSNESTGTYFIKITNSNYFNAIFKIVKE